MEADIMKNYQRISMLAVLIIFLLSIAPLAWAEENSDVNINQSGPRESRTEFIKEQAMQGLQQARTQLINSREEYQKIKQGYAAAITTQVEHRQTLQQLNKAVKKCNTEAPDCLQAKLELKRGIKNHLLKTIDVVERALDKLTNQVENIEGLSDEEREKALEIVITLEDRLNQVTEKINAFNEETSREEISTVITELKKIAQDTKKLQRRLVALLVNIKLGQLVEKHEEFRNGMQLRIDSLKTEGADVSELESLLKVFDDQVEALKEDYETANTKWKNIDSAANFDTYVKDLRSAQNEVRKDLKGTKKALRDFIQKYTEIKRDLMLKNTIPKE